MGGLLILLVKAVEQGSENQNNDTMYFLVIVYTVCVFLCSRQ